MLLTSVTGLVKTNRVRQHLLIVLKTVLEANELGHLDLLVELDRHLTAALRCLSHLGVNDRSRCVDELAAAQADLDLLLELRDKKDKLMGQLLQHADSFLKGVRKDILVVGDAPDNSEPAPTVGAVATLALPPVPPPTPPPPNKWHKSVPFEGVLSDREREVLKLFAQGFTAAQAGKRLGISEATVRTHRERARTKLKCRSVIQAVAMYVAAESEDFSEAGEE